MAGRRERVVRRRLGIPEICLHAANCRGGKFNIDAEEIGTERAEIGQNNIDCLRWEGCQCIPYVVNV